MLDNILGGLDPFKKYLYFALALALIGWGVYTWSLKQENDQLHAEKGSLNQQLQQTQDVNEVVNRAMDRIQTLRKKDQKMLDAIHTLNQRVDNQLHKQDRVLDELESNNEKVERYLNRPVPVELRRVLNQSDNNRDSDGSGEASGAESETVQESGE